MELNKYLNAKDNKRKILIVSDLNKGQGLLRRYEELTGDLVCNVTCMTLSQLAEQVYLYIQSDEGFEKQHDFLDSTEALMLFREIIFQKINELSYFNDENMMDFATTKEIFDKANLVRANGWTGEEMKSPNVRVSDLKLLITEYEQRLVDGNLLDSLALFQYIITGMKSWDNLPQELDNIFAGEISYLVEEMDCLNGVQQDFLCLLQSNQEHAVSLYTENLAMDNFAKWKDKADFYKGFGSFNEMSYVANDILSKEIPLGSVSVIYTSSAQLPAIYSAIRGNGIPMNVISNHSIRDNAYISLARRMIAWARDNYSEKGLEKIFASSVIGIETDTEDGKKVNILGRQNYFNYVFEARNRRENGFSLGWGYERNLEFIAHERKHVKDDLIPQILDMHAALLDIFGEQGMAYDDEQNMVRPITVYKKLLEFISNYTFFTDDYAMGVDSIKRLSGAINFEQRSLPFSQVLNFIDELLAGISSKDASSDDAVSVQYLDDWVLLERPYVYIIGLSLKDMQTNTTESPVLSDDEMLNYLGEGYKPTVKNNAGRKDTNLYRTLMSFTGEHITFGYSSYDTVGFCESNPSGFFRDALYQLKGITVDDLTEFVYGNPTTSLKLNISSDIKLRDDFDVRLETSNSAMEVLLDCPKKYAFAKKIYIPENEFVEVNDTGWLDNRLKGSFFHDIADQYVEAKLVKPASQDYDEKVDNALIEQIAKGIEAKMLTEMPVAYPELAELETKELIQVASDYLQQLHDELKATGWRALLTEQKFIKANYGVEDYNKKVYRFVFSGAIDRIDYRIDRGTKKIYLRIIDYKTGKKEAKEKEQDIGKLLQYVVYKKALMETGVCEDDHNKTLLVMVKERIAALELIQDIDTWDVEFDTFQYIFPMQGAESLVVLPDGMESKNLTRLKVILTALEEKQIYPDHLELVGILKEYINVYGSKDSNIQTLYNIIMKPNPDGTDGLIQDEIKYCAYCSYGNLCEHRKAGDIK